VRFPTQAKNSFHSISPGDSNEKADAFLKDLQTGEIACCSTSADRELGDEFSEGVSMTSDARYVILLSASTNLVPAEASDQGDIFLKDLETGEVVSCSSLAAEMPGNCSEGGAISPDGRYLVVTITSEDSPDYKTNIYRLEVQKS